jgi:endoglucanase Acf2
MTCRWRASRRAVLITTAIAFLVAAMGAACGPGTLAPRPRATPPLAGQKVGAGFVLTHPPADAELPSNRDRHPVLPKVTADFAGVPTSNDWWSSLIWQADARGINPYSEPMYAHPLTLRARADGLLLGYPTRPEVTAREYMYRATEDLVVGLQGLDAPATRVAAYSDWTVTASWQRARDELRVTFGHGLPFVYCKKTGPLPARIATTVKSGDGAAARADVLHAGDDFLVLRVNDHVYAAFAPSGASWRASGDAFVSDLAGKDFFSVAVLPDARPATVQLFRSRAFAFVTDTRASWRYDATTATLRSTFEVKTELEQAGPESVDEALLALYRHQWRNTDTPLLDLSYLSPRGEMKLMSGKSFATAMRFNGVLPILPRVEENDHSDLEFYVKQIYWRKDEQFPLGLGEKPERDSYWDGKSLFKLANALQIADQIGYVAARDYLLQAVKNELEDWFDGREPRALYYDKNWRTLIPVPGGFGSGLELNDHHFHYGYFVFAAAIVARFDRAWAERFADDVEMLIRDAANWDRRDDRFPFLRYMDVYAGHSWANGPAEFLEGNNEESSSEDVNFSAATILWGALTEQPALRDLGIFLYTQQTAAIEQYWWDVDHAVFPDGFDHTAVAMVWGAGGRYDTWWDPNPIFVHGINVVPAGGGSLYMGRHPDYILRNYGEMAARNRGDPLTWRDLSWMYLALAKPDRAAELLGSARYFTPEFGNSMAMTRHWIDNLVRLGQLDTTVTADIPTYAAFRRGNERTHVAFNPTARALRVAFSDGASIALAPHELGYVDDRGR